jgi:hypothetical protein
VWQAEDAVQSLHLRDLPRNSGLNTQQHVTKNKLLVEDTGHTQKNGAVSLATHIWTAPFFCVCHVYLKKTYSFILSFYYETIDEHQLRILYSVFYIFKYRNCK